MLAEFVPAQVFVVLLVFARMGTVFMLLPGFSEAYVAPRLRLILAVTVTIVVTPIVRRHLPPMPASPLLLFLILAGEIAVGLFLGLATRFLVTSLHVAGMVVSMQSALASATVFDPAQASQGSLIGSLLTVTAVLLMFSTGLHHLLLRGVVDSYLAFPPGAWGQIGDFAELALGLFSSMFRLGLQIAAPVTAVTLILFLGLGLLGRLMPAVQVFFIAMPLQILISFIVVAITMSAALLWFLENFEEMLSRFLVAG